MSPHSRKLEHRCSVRHALGIPVQLRGASGPLVPGQLVNIGAGGACVRLAGGKVPGRLVELVGAGSAAWPALVVHRQEAMLGLMFDRPRFKEVRSLLDRSTNHIGSAAA